MSVFLFSPLGRLVVVWLSCFGAVYQGTVAARRVPVACIRVNVIAIRCRPLLHLQNRFQVMSYSGDHETSHLCPYTFEKGAQGSAGRAALQRRLRPASLPDTLGERRWRDHAAHIAENLGCASQTV